MVKTVLPKKKKKIKIKKWKRNFSFFDVKLSLLIVGAKMSSASRCP